jgi:hypothetical protein
MRRTATAAPFILVLALTLFCCSIPPALSEEQRFTDNGDGTVTDHKLGLMWAKTDNQGDTSWKDAERYCKYTFPVSLGKYDDWRMPTLEELKSLHLRDPNYKGYETDCGQMVKIFPEIELSCGWVWSSEKSSISAKVYNFHRGYHYTDRMVHKRNYRALPVRTLKPGE